MSFQRLHITRGKSGDFMAKKNINNQDEQLELENNSPGFLKKFLYLFLIPLMFTVAIILVVTTVTNTNVFKIAGNVAEKIPFIKKEEPSDVENSSLSGEKVVALQAEIQEKEVQITQLQTQIETADTEKDELLAEQERLQFEIEKLKRNQEETQKEFTEILATFEKMSAKKAAPILVQMSDTESLRIMSSMKPDTLAELFTKMQPADAARYTELLSQQ